MFNVSGPFTPKGDQPKAIAQVVDGFKKGAKAQTLLGATGTGKTLTMAHIASQLGKPTLVLCHNKTLAAQLWSELNSFFPDNAVEYFVSYYDYYQPESYLPSKDMYIEKDMSINEKIERMRLSAVHSLSTRDDVILVASVSCIYGLGDPEEFRSLVVGVSVGEKLSRKELISRLVHIQYERNDTELKTGRFRVRGDTIDIIPGYSENIIRISLFDDEVESITELSFPDMTKLNKFTSIKLFPAKNYVFSQPRVDRALVSIREELDGVLPSYEMLEAHRLKQRTEYDLEMIKEMGYCTGIENYSRHFDGRSPGVPPYTLLDYFPDDFLMIIDESHVALPQVRAMYAGDKARKKNLIEYGFRLPCAYDNRPLQFSEFTTKLDKVLYVSATPADYELEHSEHVVEQIIRPTGLVDPIVDVLPAEGQVADLLIQCQRVIETGNRVLVTTLTKRMSEHLTDFLEGKGLKVKYLHSEIDTLERVEIIRQLRAGVFDVLVGINLLREGLDLPEVALVAILDADKEGFLRNTRSLIQTIGRAARNESGRVILYGDKMTDSMRAAIDETNRRRAIQIAHNEKHGITPVSVSKPLPKEIQEIIGEKKKVVDVAPDDVAGVLEELEKQMELAAESLEFERAIDIRDQIRELEAKLSKQK